MLALNILCILLHIFALFRLYISQPHTNEFAVRIQGPLEQANYIARKYGFVNRGQVGSLEGYYIFEHPHIEKRSTEPSSFHVELLQSDPDIEWCEQQVIKSRVKRSNVKEPTDFIDPLYPEQWFLHDGGYDGYDMNVRPAWNKGYTGKGVVVSILDDGIQGNHPDLELNYDKDASIDINSGDDDPSPRDNDDNKHGTRCAGEVAAVANNEFCGVGVAYNAKIGGVRMLDGSVTDKIEAIALSLKPNHIDIYSASWGPEDDGKTVDGPGILAQHAFIEGVRKGRNGLGSIFVWASGNGGKHSDNCNCDGYTNSIHTISISSATQSGLKPWYLEECSSTLATTYSSGERNRDRNIVTVDVNYGYANELKQQDKSYSPSLCTKSHTGTSASAPIAAGLCALALEANRNLSWRDLQYIIVLTSRYIPLRKEDGWILNGVGRNVSTKFGYGLMDGDAMVTVAKEWNTLHSQHICYTFPDRIERIISPESGGRLEASMSTDGCKYTNTSVKYLEHVQVRITLTFHPRGNLRIILVSPSGTPSPILLPRIHDRQEGSFLDWPFLSVHFWGEIAEGTWRLVIINEGNLMDSSPGKLKSWSLTFYGTDELPDYLIPSAMEKKNQNGVEHPHPIRGLTDSSVTLMDCKSQKQFLVILENEHSYCTNKCPPGMYGSRKQSICRKCNKICSACYGPSYNHCLICISNYLLLDSTCVKYCPKGYFSDFRSGICLPCPTFCHACEDAYTCILCRKDFYYFNSRCLPYCPPGTYASGNKCIECSDECKNCYGPSNSDCVACSDDFYLFNTTCLSECPIGYFLNNEEKCVKCHRSCKSCDSQSACTSCSEHYNLHQEHGICKIVNCRSADPDIKCQLNCSPNCSHCYNEDCKICKPEFLWADGVCLKSCSVSSYEFFDECRQCLGKCLRCEDPYHCSSCQNGFYLIQSHCVEVCPDGYYGDNNGMCKQCHASCENCFGASSSECTSCPHSKFLYGNTCVDICPAGFYGDVKSMKCFICHSSCKECSKYGPFSCLGCYPGSNLLENSCIPCLDEEFLSSIDKECEKCHDNCEICDEVKHQCGECCYDKRNNKDGQKRNKNICCFCKNHDICIRHDASDIYNKTTKWFEEDDPVSKKVVPVVIGVSSIVIVVFVLLFIILQYGSSIFYGFFRHKKYYAFEFRADFDAEQEKLSLTQEDLEEDDEISQKI